LEQVVRQEHLSEQAVASDQTQFFHQLLQRAVVAVELMGH
jgi:hypothetical protein